MITLMRGLLCSSVNAESSLMRRSDKYENMGNGARHRVNSILHGREPCEINEKILVYDMGDFQIIEYVIFGSGPISFLWIRVKEHGEMFPFWQLLLGNYFFQPVALNNVSCDISRVQKERQISKYDCRNYTNSDNTFCVNNNYSGSGIVLYKDLTIPGNMFSFLHEIVHVWQAMVWPREMHALSCMKFSIANLDFNNSLNGNIAEVNDVLVRYSPKISLVHYSDCVLDSAVKNKFPENTILSMRKHVFFFENEKDVTSKLLHQYIWRERHAWIVALQLLKHLSKNLVNIEPTLSISQLKQYTQDKLQTHKNSLNEMLKHDWRHV